MKRHLGLILICACSAFAIGCEPSADDDELTLGAPADIEAPINEAKSKDYNEYSMSLQIHSPVGVTAEGVDSSSQAPSTTHYAGRQRLPSDAN